MFEKEAEEYAVLNARQYIHNEGIDFCTSEEEVRQAYQKGAEFGYNKAKGELEEENAELKKELKISQRCWQDQKNISLNANCSLHKAKEIIKDFILMAKVEHLKDRYETVDEAEQFIRE